MFLRRRASEAEDAKKIRTDSTVRRRTALATWLQRRNADAGRYASACISRADDGSAAKAAGRTREVERRGPGTAADNSPQDGGSSVRGREERWPPNRASKKADW